MSNSNSYLSLKNKHSDEVNNFPMIFAFSQEQLKEGMEKLGLTTDDTDKVVSIGTGGIIRKTDVSDFKEMFSRHSKEMKEAIEADKTGEGFICDMFRYELANHEYGYTGELEDTLDALGLTYSEVISSQRLARGLEIAKLQIE